MMKARSAAGGRWYPPAVLPPGASGREPRAAPHGPRRGGPCGLLRPRGGPEGSGWRAATGPARGPDAAELDPPPQTRRRRRPGAALACAVLLGLPAVPACTDSRGIVQIAWAFVDRSGATVFPAGDLGDTCSFRGALDGRDRDYDLQIAVRVCDPTCAGGCDDDACLIVDPLLYSCLSARGSSEVPSSESPYQFQVDVIAEFDETCACVVQAPCAEVPGPRLRMVRPGLITDLQVYQLVLDMQDVGGVFDLDGCCELPPGCA